MAGPAAGPSDGPATPAGCYCGCPTCPGTGAVPHDATTARWLHAVLPPSTAQPWVLLPFGAVWSGTTEVGAD
ncbi:hypothetical protein [Cellulomonas fimi]|uniref:Signal peptidase I n=1 Tax=Cellulomonas fimi (strain ATCC 484 / DSM 20113 / JCM 1341 / CCUG 24087 / LMG 16345 / NBRC 15513 / NCIMB 8980 / NCTC 7547 / NRS-133) TaxID=590998 RepID=F4H4K4_CELFA|nr:hypothetical protein [Cellulomonas fimi]AEE47799.1 signal peptidase I [Cellulomonas fimi ATCC 484]NNH06063.1 hypothetical protein [Cellulomonas fimi]VEH37026.1 Uncharacterised protein [Cellulomonas fimi]